MSYFNLPEFNQVDVDFDTAAEVIKARAGGDLLKGMQEMQQLWEDYCRTDMSDDYEGDDDFYDCWEYEMNCYNVVHDNMSKLFV